MESQAATAEPAPISGSSRDLRIAPYPPKNKWSVAFGVAMGLGILADWVLGIPAIFAPNQTLELFGLRASANPAWVAFSALLVVLLSLFYIPGAISPYRYPASAWLGVLCRPPGVLFFLVLWPGQYTLFGLLDLLLFAVQAPLLILAMRAVRWSGETQEEVHAASTPDVFEYDGSTFAEVKAVAFSGPYDTLPYHRGLGPTNFLQFLNASARNLQDRRDIRPRFDKLIHQNGICFTGVWRIDAESPYTGYFAKGSTGLILARLSVAGPLVKRGFRRSLGMGGKIWPTMDPDEKHKPGNFVVVSLLSGTTDKYVTDIVMTNKPEIGIDPIANFINRVIFRLMDTRPGFRQLHPISTLGVPRGGPLVTPDLLLLKVAESTPKVDAVDFRDELRLSNYPSHTLVYTINVRDFGDREWKRVGTIELTEDAISEGGDKRLHFWIPSDIPSRN
jgi:hypothetical protein